jgi:hypothetical protein
VSTAVQQRSARSDECRPRRSKRALPAKSTWRRVLPSDAPQDVGRRLGPCGGSRCRATSAKLRDPVLDALFALESYAVLKMFAGFHQRLWHELPVRAGLLRLYCLFDKFAELKVVPAVEFLSKGAASEGNAGWCETTGLLELNST